MREIKFITMRWKGNHEAMSTLTMTLKMRTKVFTTTSRGELLCLIFVSSTDKAFWRRVSKIPDLLCLQLWIFTKKTFEGWMKMCFLQLLLKLNKVFLPTFSKRYNNRQMCSLKPAKVEQYPERFPFWRWWLDCFSHNFPTHLRTYLRVSCLPRSLPLGVKLPQYYVIIPDRISFQSE